MPDKIILVSLRDESPERQRALHPQLFNGNNMLSLYPQDQSAGGTWVGANHKGTIIILLNGGFVCHKRRSSYAKSRGLIVTELLSAIEPVSAWAHLDLSDIEPHTLVVWHNKQLFHLTWDGTASYVIEKDKSTGHIWSSSTLYDEKASLIRKQWFDDWMKYAESYDSQKLLEFFCASGDTHSGFIINRNEVVKTLSMSFIEAKENEISYRYHDLATDEITNHLLKISAPITWP